MSDEDWELNPLVGYGLAAFVLSGIAAGCVAGALVGFGGPALARLWASR